MKPIFSRGPSLQIRLFLAVLVALGVIIADSRLGTFSQIRTYMDTAVSPFYFISNGPRELLDSVSQTLASRDQLELENRALRQELLLKNSELLMLGQYKQENARLRELLGSPLRQDEQKMVTQVISTVNDPYSDHVVIDKGSANGVYERPTGDQRQRRRQSGSRRSETDQPCAADLRCDAALPIQFCVTISA
jgi:rod shape-determining protein MreC